MQHRILTRDYAALLAEADDLVETLEAIPGRVIDHWVVGVTPDGAFQVWRTGDTEVDDLVIAGAGDVATWERAEAPIDLVRGALAAAAAWAPPPVDETLVLPDDEHGRYVYTRRNGCRLTVLWSTVPVGCPSEKPGHLVLTPDADRPPSIWERRSGGWSAIPIECPECEAPVAPRARVLRGWIPEEALGAALDVVAI